MQPIGADLTDRRPRGLGLGGASLGNLRSAISDREAAAVIDRALACGIRYFDTAPHYGLGLSERRLGGGLAAWPRDEVIVSTKVGRRLVPRDEPLVRDDDGFDVPGDLTRVWDFDLAGVRRSLVESCERLGLERVDLALVHDPDQAWTGAAESGLRSLAVLKQEGSVGAIGIGTNSTKGLNVLISDGLVDVVMLANRFTLLDHDDALPVLDAAEQAGVGVVAAGVFSTGLLASREIDPTATFEYREPDPAVVARVRRIAEVCEAHGVDVPTAALAFSAGHPAVTAVVVGMRSVREVEQNVERYATHVPTGLWDDLVAAQLLSETAAPPKAPPG